MLEFYYLLLFWLGTLSSLLLFSLRDKELPIQLSIIDQLPTIVFFSIKILPIILVCLFVFINFQKSLLAYFLFFAFLFCCLGDIGIEIKFLAGMLCFLSAHILFSITFLALSLSVGISSNDFIIMFLIFAGFVIYSIFFIKYLESSANKLGKYKQPLFIYSLALSLMASTTILYWIVNQTEITMLIVIGAFFFLISDSLIAIREFHHKMSFSRIKILGTYYMAIFLLSLAILS
jgi:uncharacterized membrane protein YhhN